MGLQHAMARAQKLSVDRDHHLILQSDRQTQQAGSSECMTRPRACLAKLVFRRACTGSPKAYAGLQSTNLSRAGSAMGCDVCPPHTPFEGVLVLDALDHMQARDASILAELGGGAMECHVFHPLIC